MERSETIDLPVADYEAADLLVVAEPEQLRALADDLRGKIVVMLRERARTTTQLAEQLGLAKGTVGYHLKVLEKAGLVRVVRTRRVRALTEKYYGRTARLFVVKSEDYPDEVRAFAAAGLRQAADEIRPGDNERTTFALLHARLAPKDALRFARRLDRLGTEFRAADSSEGEPYGLAIAIYPTEAQDD